MHNKLSLFSVVAAGIVAAFGIAALAQAPLPGIGVGTGAGGPTGPAGGDLSGTYPNPGVAKINGTAFAGSNGHLVSFGASNTPADSGIVASSVIVSGACLGALGSVSGAITLDGCGGVVKTFTLTLTGNTTCGAIQNFTPGQVVTIEVTEDGTGGWTFACAGASNFVFGGPSLGAGLLSTGEFTAATASTLHAGAGAMRCVTCASQVFLPVPGSTPAGQAGAAVLYSDGTGANVLANLNNGTPDTACFIMKANCAVLAAGLPNAGVFTGDATTTFPALTIGNGAITSVKLNITTSTCTAPQVLTAISATGVGTCAYIPLTQNSQSAAYTTVLSDEGKQIYHPGADTTARTWTIDSNANVAYPVGACITFINDTLGGTITIAITADTMILAGAGTTGPRTLAASGIATACKMTTTRWIINGTGLT